MANNAKPLGVNAIWASTGNKTDPGSAKAATGWVVELPPYQTQNWIDWKQDSFIAHVNQHGVPQWDAVTEYQGNISYTKGSNGIVYKCLVTNTNIDPINPLNSTYWVQAFETYGSVQVVSNALNAHLANYTTLAGIGNVAAARVNLAVWSKTEGDARYASKVGDPLVTFRVATATQGDQAVNLTQLNNRLTQATEAALGVAKIASQATVSAGTNNTDIVTAAKLSILYLPKAGNLAGLANVATARTNLGLGSMAVEAASGFLRTTNNLSDVPDKAQARINLGLGDIASLVADSFLLRSNNLSDLTNKQSARNNLGLGGAATKNVLNVAGDLDFRSATGQTVNWYRLPNGIIVQFGVAGIKNNSRVNFSIPMHVGSIQLTIAAAQNPINLLARSCGVGDYDNNGFYATGSTAVGTADMAVFWQATGWAL